MQSYVDAILENLYNPYVIFVYIVCIQYFIQYFQKISMQGGQIDKKSDQNCIGEASNVKGTFKSGVLTLQLQVSSNDNQNHISTYIGKIMPMEQFRSSFKSLEDFNAYLDNNTLIKSQSDKSLSPQDEAAYNMLKQSQQIMPSKKQSNKQENLHKNVEETTQTTEGKCKCQQVQGITDILIKSIVDLNNKIQNIQKCYSKLTMNQSMKHSDFQLINKRITDKINKKLQDSLKKISVQIQQKIKQRNKDLEQMNTSIQKGRTQIKIFNNKFQEKQEQLNRIIDKITNLAAGNEESFDKIQDRMKKVQNNQKYFTMLDSLSLDSSQQSQKSSQIKIKGWIDEFSAHYNRLLIKGNVITLKSDEGANILGLTKLKDKQVFKIKFQKMSGVVAIVGIVDSRLRLKFEDPLRPHPEYNVIMYTNNGLIYDGKQFSETGSYGFKTGDMITVKIDFKKNVVEWKNGINNKTICSSDKIKDASINWVPLVYLSTKNDSISIWE